MDDNHELGSEKGNKFDHSPVVVGRPRNRPGPDQAARLRSEGSVAVVGGGGKKRNNNENGEDPDEKIRELERKLMEREEITNGLEKEVLSLKEQLDAAQSLNVELLLRNSQLSEDLDEAQAKVATLSSCSSSNNRKELVGDHQCNKFEDIKKHMAAKLESTILKQETKKTKPCLAGPPKRVPPPPSLVPSGTQINSHSLPITTPPPTPPPPPPPPRLPARAGAGASTSRKSQGVVEFYHSLKKWEGNNNKQDGSARQLNQNKPVASSAHSSIVDEIQNRSAHLLAIKADIETKGDFINGLIEKVHSAAYTNIEDVVSFVNWLDNQLSTLADERAVLKHFKWPERKADAMREAAVEYRELSLLETDISSYRDDASVSCAVALKKIANLLDKSERGIQKVIKLRNGSMNLYRGYGIPTEWMLDTGLVRKIKQASMKLANMYMKRIAMELQTLRHSDRESTQEALLLQGVHFAYRAHQFAGGLDSETLCAFEEIRQHVSSHIRGSRELLAGIPSS